MSTAPILYGAAYNVYVRAVRLALAEKGADYQMVEVDLGAEEGAPANYLHHASFMRIPAFEHEGERLYEASAITRYIDEAFEGPALMPDAARDRARVNQIISVIENYGYGPMVWIIFVERCRAAVAGRQADEAKIAAAVPQVAYALDALEEMADKDGPQLIGDQLTLGDLHLAAMLAYGTLAPEGAALVNARPRLARWWDGMKQRPSMQYTRSPLEH
ncbi:glutathione S-transferase family protein [Dongia deserti]|uniref:glutathione S-transferase family protein n=1 Tax=Dongia deserti TaxID=2268030 RepID=UPI0013C52205|nr:glutathione S-transferase family protein [Dongia deserti]